MLCELRTHRANAEVTGSNPVEAPKTLFGLNLGLLKSQSQLRWSHLDFICMSAVHITMTGQNLNLVSVRGGAKRFTYLIDHSPLRLFRSNETNNWNELDRSRIPTGRRQTSWLCTSTAQKLNQGLPRTNPGSGQRGTWTRDLQIFKSGALTTRPHCLSTKVIPCSTKIF